MNIDKKLFATMKKKKGNYTYLQLFFIVHSPAVKYNAYLSQCIWFFVFLNQILVTRHSQQA